MKKSLKDLAAQFATTTTQITDEERAAFMLDQVRYAMHICEQNDGHSECGAAFARINDVLNDLYVHFQN